MREIARILCGSHLYGCDVPESDRDYKIVYIPDAKRILLQQADKLDPEEMPAAVARLKKDAGLDQDPDVEFMSFRQFLKLLCQGQTNAMDMLFAPRSFHVSTPEAEWYAIEAHTHRWISKNSTAFVGYCRQQASKYSVKMDRYDAVKSVITLLAQVPPGHQKLDAVKGHLQHLVDNSDHIEFLYKEAQHGEILHLSVCQSLVPITATIKVALEQYSKKLDTYGERVTAAANMDAKDWKSMYHAVRVAEEALELLQTGKLTFPRPERRLLTAIRLGKVPFEKVSADIEENLRIVEEAVENSTLQERPDYEYADHLVATFYRSAVLCQSQPY